MRARAAATLVCLALAGSVAWLRRGQHSRARLPSRRRLAENRTTLRDFPVGTRGRWEHTPAGFVFYDRAEEPVLRLRAPPVQRAPRSHTHHHKFNAACLVRADPMVVLAGARGGWGVLGFRNDEFEPLAVLTFVTRDPARKKLAPGAVGAKLGRVEGYMRREAALFRDFARVINAINATTGPARVLDIGANHGLFALFAALRGARVAAVEAQATLASVVKVATLANGVDVDVFHNAILDVPAVVEIAELGASNDLNEGGTASLGAPREAPMAQVRTASVDLVASEVFGAAPVDFLKIDVEGWVRKQTSGPPRRVDGVFRAGRGRRDPRPPGVARAAGPRRRPRGVRRVRPREALGGLGKTRRRGRQPGGRGRRPTQNRRRGLRRVPHVRREERTRKSTVRPRAERDGRSRPRGLRAREPARRREARLCLPVH